MFRFYGRGHELAIQRAAKDDNWDKVNRLYKTTSTKNFDLLDDAICDGVMSKTMFDGMNIQQASNYLLRAFTLGPATIRLELVERLRKAPLFAELERESKFVTLLAEVAVDIFTVMVAKKYDYHTALNHVNNDLEIPRTEAFLASLKKIMI